MSDCADPERRNYGVIEEVRVFQEFRFLEINIVVSSMRKQSEGCLLKKIKAS